MGYWKSHFNSEDVPTYFARVRPPPPPVVLQLARMECVHEKHIIYRDTKPENFLAGRREMGEHNKIYMIDFGLVCVCVVCVHACMIYRIDFSGWCACVYVCVRACMYM